MRRSALSCSRCGRAEPSVVVRAIGPGRATGFLNLMPFVVIGLAWLIVGEAVHAYHLVGAVLVIAGVFLATR